MTELTQERLKEVLHYDPSTGAWTWLVSLSSRAVAGSSAARFDVSEYPRISVDGTLYYAHRLAVLYMTGAWPKATVDHKHRNPNDCRWEHLRPASYSQQGMNRRVQSNNTTGTTGVCWHKAAEKWAAEIMVGGQKKHLGLYKDFDRACEVRRAAEIAAFGEFVCR